MLNTETVLVTGGASGLGLAVASALLSADAHPVVLDLKPPPDPGMDHLVVDLGDSAAAEEAVAEAQQRFGPPRAVVTAAGIDRCGDLETVPTTDWEQVLRVNLFGTVAVVRAALPALRRCRGRVVTVASTLGLRALPAATAYCASKFGVVGFTRALAAETAGEVGVTLLVPGGMRTAFFDDRPDRFRPAADAELNPPDAVAASVLFALAQPVGCEIRELVVCPSTEPSWP
jgi:2-dehydro-3-deoxy-L-rhamnonate dehydrogenase (NAD+)